SACGGRRGARSGCAGPRCPTCGFACCGLALAAAAGTTFPALLARRVLEPLGMRDTSIPASPAEIRDGALRGHSGRGAPRAPWTMTGYAPAGGVRSAARDMPRLGAALLHRPAAGAGAPAPGR